MKKYIIGAVILIVILGIFSPVFAVAPPSEPAPENTKYKLLTPLPGGEGGGLLTEFDTKKGLGEYLNLIIKLVIGISAVLAVVMIVMGGIEYIGSELISNKEEGRERIKNALFGLLIAMGAWALLNTINPNLLNSDIKIPEATVSITVDQANFAITERTQAAVGSTYVVNSTSAGVEEFARSGGDLTSVNVNTANKTASFCKGAQCVSVPINIGFNGVSQPGQAIPGDSKTPIGTTIISGDIRIGNNGNAVISNGGYNLGAAFINLGIKDSAGNDRGIGFHGSYNDRLGTTNGCVRMNNGDLIALAPLLKPGTRVTIG